MRLRIFKDEVCTDFVIASIGSMSDIWLKKCNRGYDFVSVDTYILKEE